MLDDACVRLGQVLAEQTLCPAEVLNSLLNILPNRWMNLEQVQPVPQELEHRIRYRVVSRPGGQQDEMDRSVSLGTADICSRAPWSLTKCHSMSSFTSADEV